MRAKEIVISDVIGKVVYHGTSCINVDIIMKEGLQPFVCSYSIPSMISHEEQEKISCDKSNQFVYVTPKIATAKIFAVEFLDEYSDDDYAEMDLDGLGYVLAFEILPTDIVTGEMYYDGELTIKNMISPDRLSVAWKGENPYTNRY